MNKETYVPTPVHRLVVIKLIKKLLGFLAPSFQYGSKRRDMAFNLYEQVKEFERELARCVTVADMQGYAKDIWVNLQERELPSWLIDALYSTLTFDPRKTKRCPSVCRVVQKSAGVVLDTPVDTMDINTVQVGDTVELTTNPYSDLFYTEGNSYVVTSVVRDGDTGGFLSFPISLQSTVKHDIRFAFSDTEVKLVKRQAS